MEKTVFFKCTTEECTGIATGHLKRDGRDVCSACYGEKGLCTCDLCHTRIHDIDLIEIAIAQDGTRHIICTHCKEKGE